MLKARHIVLIHKRLFVYNQNDTRGSLCDNFTFARGFFVLKKNHQTKKLDIIGILC